MKISLKCPDVSLCFASSDFNCGVRLTLENHWVILVDSPINPPQSQFNHFEDLQLLFRHMVHHILVHARSRANFIKRASLCPKLCTKTRDSVLKPAHAIGGCRSSPEDRTQRSPWFSRPAIQVAASPESHILSDSTCFKDLIIKLLSGWPAGNLRVNPRVIEAKEAASKRFAVQVPWGAMLHAKKFYLA